MSPFFASIGGQLWELGDRADRAFQEAARGLNDGTARALDSIRARIQPGPAAARTLPEAGDPKEPARLPKSPEESEQWLRWALEAEAERLGSRVSPQEIQALAERLSELLARFFRGEVRGGDIGPLREAMRGHVGLRDYAVRRSGGAKDGAARGELLRQIFEDNKELR